MSNWNKIFKPIVVLCAICIVVTGALAATNSVTAPIIQEAIIAAETAARTELLPEADDFTLVEGVAVENVSAVYAANNGTGYVITSSSKGYGGAVVVMTAIDAEGNIKQIKVTQQAETQGLGTKVTTVADYWANYSGKPADTLTLGVDVDAVSGATISSRALNNAVNSAIEAYKAIG